MESHREQELDYTHTKSFFSQQTHTNVLDNLTLISSLSEASSYSYQLVQLVITTT